MRGMPSKPASGDGALILRRHATEQGVVIDLAANEVLRIGRGGDECAGAVDQEHGIFRLLADTCGELVDPLQIDRGQNDADDGAIRVDRGKRAEHGRYAVGRIDEVVAQREFARFQRMFENATDRRYSTRSRVFRWNI